MASIFEATAGKLIGPTTGGTVTQATNKTTGVTLNAASGQITMNGASLAGGAEATFTVTNSEIAATDVWWLTTAPLVLLALISSRPTALLLVRSRSPWPTLALPPAKPSC